MLQHSGKRVIRYRGSPVPAPAWAQTCQKPSTRQHATSTSNLKLSCHSSLHTKPTNPLRKQMSISKSFTGTLRCASTAARENSLLKTALFDVHIRHGGKMVGFGGYHMPLQYDDLSHMESHHWTRQRASLFDVSHMVQYHLSGPGVDGFLSKITPSSISKLENHTSTLSCFLHRNTGGIVDDTVITRLGKESIYFVANAAGREKDFEFLTSELKEWNENNRQAPAELEQMSSHGLVAIQGPIAHSLLQPLLVNPQKFNLSTLYFGQSMYVPLRISSPGRSDTTTALVSRAGYTGEDGFELSIPSAEESVAFTETLLREAGPEKLRLAGLAARDSLRLEAGMCLYGHDLDDSTTPVEGGLSWIIGRDRRTPETAGFNGDEVILRQLQPKSAGGGVQRRRVGMSTATPAREGARIVDINDSEVGIVTSGCPSPTLGRNIAMGYVKDGLHKGGTNLGVNVRGKVRQAVVEKMPFVPTKYHRVVKT